MPIQITITDADFSANNIGRGLYLTTERDGLVGEYLFGFNAAASVVNPPGANMSVIGTPTYSANLANVGQLNYFDTGILEPDEFTFLIFSDGDRDVSSVLVGNFNGSNSATSCCLYRNGSSFTGFSPATDSTTVTAAATNSLAEADQRAYAMRSIGTTDFSVTVDEFKAGVRSGGATTTSTKTRRANASSLVLGSSRGSATFPGPHPMYAALIWSRALSDAELLAAYLEVRAVLAGRSLAA